MQTFVKKSNYLNAIHRTTSTTPVSVFNPVVWCASKAATYYPHPSLTTCTKYVYCYENDGMKGAVYTCPTPTKFNPSTKKCEASYTC